ncbi:hypothetical protein L227DRAFT_164457 [Lentinus tigrinus ALCF2SS1-6]|uniref:Uncharacterized protein n=1 Tax=Lentinus tigrinus ALCF2SS1-6 TaxID=1328759 RepID=A0A5C2S7P9_9APHY|nr:hypothetical protein L227DRAFT_164457 [Lentinus tigrinus ALCF2SS1-6]
MTNGSFPCVSILCLISVTLVRLGSVSVLLKFSPAQGIIPSRFPPPTTPGRPRLQPPGVLDLLSTQASSDIFSSGRRSSDTSSMSATFANARTQTLYFSAFCRSQQTLLRMQPGHGPRCPSSRTASSSSSRAIGRWCCSTPRRLPSPLRRPRCPRLNLSHRSQRLEVRHRLVISPFQLLCRQIGPHEYPALCPASTLAPGCDVYELARNTVSSLG